MMVHAKYENERRITVFLLSGSFSSFVHQLTLRLVRALQSPSPSEIAKSQKRNNSLCGMTVQANHKIMKERRTILLSGRDSSSKQDWHVSVWRFTKPPMPSEIAAKTDMCENGSEMVQAKYKVKCEKINDLTFGN